MYKNLLCNQCISFSLAFSWCSHLLLLPPLIQTEQWSYRDHHTLAFHLKKISDHNNRSMQIITYFLLYNLSSFIELFIKRELFIFFIQLYTKKVTWSYTEYIGYLFWRQTFQCFHYNWSIVKFLSGFFCNKICC